MESSKEKFVDDVGSLVEAISADDDNATPLYEVESLCMRCTQNGTTRFLLTSIPHFRKVLLSAFECPHCGERNNEVQFAGEIQPKGCHYRLEVQSGDPKMFSRQVVKSESATIKIPELDFEIPPEAQRGSLSTVEGILVRAIDGLQALQEERKKADPQTAEAIDQFLLKLKACATVITLEYHDVIRFAPSPDPSLSIRFYDRTPEQQASLGYLVDSSSQFNVPQASMGETNNDVGQIRRQPHGSVGAAAGQKAIAQSNSAEIAEALFRYSAPEEVMTFPSTCGACAARCETRMYATSILRNIVMFCILSSTTFCFMASFEKISLSSDIHPLSATADSRPLPPPSAAILRPPFESFFSWEVHRIKLILFPTSQFYPSGSVKSYTILQAVCFSSKSSFPDLSMEPLRSSKHRRTSGLAATTAAGAASVNSISTSSGPDNAINFSFSGKEKRERESEKERTKLRRWNRRAFTRRLLAGLRQFGNFHLSERSNMNDVLATLAREAGWTVEADGTTFRQSPSPQKQQNSRVFSARLGDSPLSTGILKNCSAKATSDCHPLVDRIDDNGLSSSQGGKQKLGTNSVVQTTPALPFADIVQDGTKESIMKGYSYEKFSEVTRRRKNEFQNWSKDGHPRIGNGIRNGVRFGFIRYATIEESRRAISKMNGSRIDGSKVGVSYAKFKPRHSYWRKSSSGVLRKSGMEDDSRKNHYKVEGVIDEEKLQVLSNCLVGWCRDFVKIGHLARQMQAKGLTGFTLMRAAGNAILMIFEGNASLRSVKNDKSNILAEWFSIVEAWSESLVMECRRVWLVCEGVPFHAWNWDTFKNIVDKWGLLLAIDESCQSPSSFDRAKIQVLIKADARIDAMVELKVGDNFFKVMVHEIEPSFKPNSWAPEEDESH
ncbi:zinc finger protein ZPR1-like isoform X2 [Hibiscus syriacus]|uniref:Zinc finger protein ZPR1-like isoform X2 n=1 Tax=Hibiscus syriacus TaxID=106335 RepID=A0A6A2XX45_HIBSY|nr:zinc finger protein ZPR1-like isoform X2 [Hibiscus syriacus]